jgi:hypothetical protein
MAALTRNKYAIKTKNRKRLELIDNLYLLSNYVLYMARLDVENAASSGFSILKENNRPFASSATVDLTKPVKVTLADGPNAGELVVSFEKVPGAKGYLYQYTPEPVTPQSVWATQAGTVRRATFKNLQSKERYCVRIAALGINDQMVFSDVVMRVVQ